MPCNQKVVFRLHALHCDRDVRRHRQWRPSHNFHLVVSRSLSGTLDGDALASVKAHRYSRVLPLVFDREVRSRIHV